MASITQTQRSPASITLDRRKLLKSKMTLVRINWELYVLIIAPVVWLVIFRYIPLAGNVIAFKDYVPLQGVWGSEWVGFENIARFINSYNFGRIMWNTIFLNLYQVLAGFPVPILLALLIHYCPLFRYKKTVQMITYAPHFISTVVIVGILFKLLATRIGLVNIALEGLGFEQVDFLGRADMFRDVFVLSGVWQHMGWSSIIYLAALAGIDPNLHQAARVDGASIWRRIWHIDLPGIGPTIMVLLILRMGQMFRVGFEKVLLMQNSLNIDSSEVVQTFVYKVGLTSSNPDFAYAAAIGFFNNFLSFVLVVTVNRVAKRFGETSLW